MIVTPVKWLELNFKAYAASFKHDETFRQSMDGMRAQPSCLIDYIFPCTFFMQHIIAYYVMENNVVDKFEVTVMYENLHPQCHSPHCTN